jgi:hypothetical protein
MRRRHASSISICRLSTADLKSRHHLAARSQSDYLRISKEDGLPLQRRGSCATQPS